MAYCLGKQPAVADHRMAWLRDVFDHSALPPAPQRFNWRSDLPDAGVRMLGNNLCGNCCWASAFHLIELGSVFTVDPLPSEPTEDECIAAYSAGTGYDPNDPVTDQGTVMMGPGGMVEFWIKQGVTCGGKLNKLTEAVKIDFNDLDQVDAALSLGPLMVGALITTGNATGIDFLWDLPYGAIAGGHEFLVIDRERLRNGRRYYDIMTWDGLWRCSEDWLHRAVDEILLPLNMQWFDRHGANPAGLDLMTVRSGMEKIAMA